VLICYLALTYVLYTLSEVSYMYEIVINLLICAGFRVMGGGGGGRGGGEDLVSTGLIGKHVHC
jgi:hypothetical protein